MIYAQIQTSLDAVLAAVAGIPAIQLENTLYNAKGRALTPFARTTLLPTQSTQRSVGVSGKNTYGGLFQIDLFYPLDKGKGTPNIMADAVIAAFNRRLITTPAGVQLVIQTAWCEAGRADDQYYNLPVVVQWQSIA